MIRLPRHRIIIGAQRSFVDDDRLGQIVRQADLAGRGAEFGSGLGHQSGLGDLCFDVTGQRHFHARQLRQGKYFVRNIGGHQVGNSQTDREGFCGAPVAGRHVGMPAAGLGAVGNLGIGRHRKTIGHALEHQIGLGDIPDGVIGFVVEADFGIGDADGFNGVDRRTRSTIRRTAKDAEQARRTTGHVRRCIHVFLVGFACDAGWRLIDSDGLALRCGLAKAQFELAFEVAHDANLGADQLQRLRHDVAGKDLLLINADGSAWRAGNKMTCLILEFDVAQPQVRHTIFGPLDDDARDSDRHAGQIGVDLALDRRSHEIKRHRTLRQTKIDGGGRDQQKGQNRHDAVSGNLNQPPHRVPVPLFSICLLPLLCHLGCRGATSHGHAPRNQFDHSPPKMG